MRRSAGPTGGRRCAALGPTGGRRPAVVAAAAAAPIAVLVGVLAFWQLGGFPGGPVTPKDPATSASPRAQSSVAVALPAPSLQSRRSTVCQALVTGLPEAIGLATKPDAARDLRRRPVTAGAAQNAAYGDPAITLTCGVPVATFPATSVVFPLSGVCWYAEERTDSTVWTTVDREVPVQVTVPRDYSGPGQWVSVFSPQILATVASVNGPPGCYRQAQPQG